MAVIDDKFAIIWQNTHGLHEAVITYTNMLVTRVPSMSTQTIGVNLKRRVREWVEDRKVTSVAWGGEPVEDPDDIWSSIETRVLGNPYEVDDTIWDDLATLRLELLDEVALARAALAEINQDEDETAEPNGEVFDLADSYTLTVEGLFHNECGRVREWNPWTATAYATQIGLGDVARNVLDHERDAHGRATELVIKPF